MFDSKTHVLVVIQHHVASKPPVQFFSVCPTFWFFKVQIESHLTSSFVYLKPFRSSSLTEGSSSNSILCSYFYLLASHSANLYILVLLIFLQLLISYFPTSRIYTLYTPYLDYFSDFTWFHPIILCTIN